MSLDVLFTEAAEAGGPPRFTEDDIAQQVGARRRRRRGLATGGAALIVVAGVGLGVLLSGQGDEATPVVEPEEIPAVPMTEPALYGDWTAVPDPEWQGTGPPTTLTFTRDATFVHRGCNAFSGRWNLADGRLGIGGGGVTTAVACGDGRGTADWAFSSGVATLYEDGLLRFATGGSTVDYVRDTDPTPADPAAARQPAARPVVVARGDVIGRWLPVGTDATQTEGPFLELGANGRFSFSGCNEGGGRWTVERGRVRFGDQVETTLRICRPPAGQPLLDTVLAGPAHLTTDGDLVLRGPEGAVFLRRVVPDPDGDTAPIVANLTEEVLIGRWVLSDHELAPLRLPSIAFAADGRFTTSTDLACSDPVGTWTIDVGMADLDIDERVGCDRSGWPDLGRSFDETAELQTDGHLRIGELEFLRLDDMIGPERQDLIGDWIMPGARRAIEITDDYTWIGYCQVAWSYELGVFTLRVDAGCDSFDPEDQPLVETLRAGAAARFDGTTLYLASHDQVVRVLTPKVARSA